MALQAPKIICCRTSLKFFRFYQTYPREGTELNPGKWFYIKFWMLCFLGSVLVVGCTLHLIHSLKSQNFQFIFRDASYIFSQLGCYSFFVLSTINYKCIAKLFMFCSNFETFGKPPDFDKRNERMNRFSKYHGIYVVFVVASFYFFSNILRSGQCRKENELYNLNEICGLVANVWLPFDIDYFPLKQIYLAWQTFSVFYVYVAGGLIPWFIFESIEHIIIRMQHVRKLFVDALNEEDRRKMEKDFHFAVRYHAAILEMGNQLNGCFSASMFCIMLLGAAIMGSTVSGLMVAGSGTLVLVCGSWFFALAMICNRGEHLTNECLTIGQAVYNANWYNASLSLRKDILIVLMRCQRPMKLRAGGFGVMNHAMILSVLRASYSYVSLLGAKSSNTTPR